MIGASRRNSMTPERYPINWNGIEKETRKISCGRAQPSELAPSKDRAVGAADLRDAGPPATGVCVWWKKRRARKFSAAVWRWVRRRKPPNRPILAAIAQASAGAPPGMATRIFCTDRTKMFHFGTIGKLNLTRPHTYDAL